MKLPLQISAFADTKELSVGALLCSPRRAHGGLLAKLRANQGLLTVLHLLMWYSFSTSSTFTTKVLIKQHHLSAQMLTLSSLFVSSICDFAMLTLPIGATPFSSRLQKISLRRLLYILPLSLFSVVVKVLTYWSYESVPVSVTHTCKASQPLFNVLAAYAIYRSKFSLATYLSLMPIVIGVVLASVSEMGMNDLASTGVIFAVSAAFLGVFQSIYAKYLLRSRIVVDSINMHFYSAVVSFTINMPLVLFRSSSSSHGDKFPQSSFPYWTVVICSLMQYLSSLGSSLVLSEVSELTYSIMCTMKRVVVILGAVYYFGNPVTVQSVIGMGLAVGGVGAYQLIKVHTKMHEMAGLAPLPRTVNDITKAKERRK